MRKALVQLSLIVAGAAVAPGAFADDLDGTQFRVPGAKAPVAHVPIDQEVLDPHTHKPMDPKGQIDWDGKKVSGADIITHYNQWEQFLNAHGTHVRDLPDKATLAELDVDTALEDARRHAHLASVRKPEKWQEDFHAQKTNPPPPPHRGLKSSPRGEHAGKPFDYAKNWAFDKKAGDNKNGVDVSGSFKIHVSNPQVLAAAEGHVKGYIVGHEIDVLNVNASSESDTTGGNNPNSGASHVRGSLTVLGKELWNTHADAQLPNLRGSLPVWSYTGGPSWQFTVMVGPIPVHIEVSIKASLGVDLNYAIGFLSARADLVPRGGVVVDAKAGIDIGIGGGGIGCNVNLVQDQFDLGGQASLDESNDGSKVVLDLTISGKNHFQALDGKLYAWVRLGPSFCCSKTWNIDIVKWKAPINLNTTVFSWNLPVELFNMPTGGAPLPTLRHVGTAPLPAPLPANGAPPAGLAALNEFTGASGSFVATGAGAAPGFSNKGAIGRVEEGPGNGAVPLYACAYSKPVTRTVPIVTFPFKMINKSVTTQQATGGHFESLDARCGGQIANGVAGYVWRDGGNGRKAVNVCRNNDTSMIAVGADCPSGHQKEETFYVQN